VNDRLMLSSINWTYIVCDEAQALKNPKSSRRQAVATLPRKYTIPVTGTPVENSLVDLWSLLDFAIPGLLGTQDAFELTYPDSEDDAAALSEVVDPVILKRRLADVAQQLPERTNVDIPLEMGVKLATEYERTRQEVLDKYPVAGQLVASGQLALFCAHPWLQAKDPEAENWEDAVEILKQDGIDLMTPKLEVTIDLLTQAFRQNKKVILFAAYNNCKAIIEEAIASLTRNAFPKAYWNAINGSTPAEDRQTILDEYSRYDGPAILVLNPKAAGSGLNIQAATVVIHYTQYWNPALEMQASARAHRTGQKNPVTVYYLYYQNSVEEIMLARTEWKRAIAGAAIPITVREEDLSAALRISPNT
ncbi:DEAD/DEAH box helicase, partial [Akkermansiaceae bacterium]|nr:DEAD/DEAH box helicase [Akkermansiaceae bacterium]